MDAAPAPGDSSQSSGTAMAPFALTAVGAGLLAKYASPAAGLAGLGVAVVLFLVMRKPREGRFVLRVEDGILEIRRERRVEPAARIAIESVLDVTLDRQAHPAAARGGSPTERVRIAFDRAAPDDPLLVPDDPITPIEGQEWLGKVRVFLRKNGWVPEDER